MYYNIGGKIKNFALVFFIIGAILIVIDGLVIISESEDLIVGLFVVNAGPVVPWVISWFIYGFGELIDKTCAIARNTNRSNIDNEIQSDPSYDRIRKLASLRSNDLITEEEYQAQRAKIISNL